MAEEVDLQIDEEMNNLSSEYTGNNVCFPPDYSFKIISTENEKFVLRAHLKNSEDAESWVRAFEVESFTRWIVTDSGSKCKQKRILYHKFWSCHLLQRKKLLPNAKTKKVGCTARLDIKIKKITPNTVKKDIYLRNDPPLNGVITINLKHNHVQDAAANLKQLRPSEEVEQNFQQYFNNGLTTAQAIQLHKCKILLMENPYEKMANGTFNPKQKWVEHQFKLWRKEHLGDHTNFLQKVKEKQNTWQEKGAEVHVVEKEGQWVVLVVTPIMRRLQKWQCAKELIFIDSSASCDTSSSTVTVILAATKAGAIPLCFLIHNNQSEEGYLAAFGTLKSHYPNCFGGQNAPLTFMTDDSAAEKNALRICWPDSDQLLCHFHVAQAEWRWLLASKNGISANRRQYLMKVFQNIMYADTDNKLEMAIETLEECPEKKFVSRVIGFLRRKEEWVTFYRKEKLIRGNNTNNFSEATVRVIKDIVLARVKAFNVVALVDYCVNMFEEYLSQRIYNSAVGVSSDKTFYDNLLGRMPDTLLPLVQKIDEETYTVPSVTEANCIYTVNIQLGICTCHSGRSGSFCKHQAFVHKNFGGPFPNCPPVTTEDRFLLGQLALGSKCPKRSFFFDLMETSNVDYNEAPNVETVSTEEAETPQRNDCSLDILVNDDEDRNYEEIEEERRRLTENLFNLHSVADKNPNYLKCLKALNSSLSKLTTSNAVHEALLTVVTSLKGRSKRRIITVQSTSVAKRRSGASRSNKRIAAGRPAGNVKVRNVKVVKKKRRNTLKLNISLNIANAR